MLQIRLLYFCSLLMLCIWLPMAFARPESSMLLMIFWGNMVVAMACNITMSRAGMIGKPSPCIFLATMLTPAGFFPLLFMMGWKIFKPGKLEVKNEPAAAVAAAPPNLKSASMLNIALGLAFIASPVFLYFHSLRSMIDFVDLSLLHALEILVPFGIFIALFTLTSVGKKLNPNGWVQGLFAIGNLLMVVAMAAHILEPYIQSYAYASLAGAASWSAYPSSSILSMYYVQSLSPLGKFLVVIAASILGIRSDRPSK